MANYYGSAYEDERKKNQDTNFGLGYTGADTQAAAGQSIPKPKPQNKLARLIDKPSDSLKSKVGTPKKKGNGMSRNRKNLLRRQGRI